MRVLIAPDSFKESMTATEAARAMARGVRRVMGDGVEIDLCPMADGGEGTVEAMVEATGGSVREARVTGPLGERVVAKWGLIDGKRSGIRIPGFRVGVIEMAQACGLGLVLVGERDPTRTTTYGVGEMMRAALDAGVKKIIVGIGGSSTNDGGVGMAQVLGVRFEEAGSLRDPGPLTGGDLPCITAIDVSSRDARIAGVEIVVACDVTNPLCGPQGAAAVYGPQKGATPEQVKELDAGLRHLASLLPHVDANAPGMGAAGGLGFGLVAFCGAKLVRGIELVMEAVRFEDRVRGCDLVLTGEGRMDGQSMRGKTCMGVAAAAEKQGVRTVALVGSVDKAQGCGIPGLAGVHAIVGGGCTLERAMREGPAMLEGLAARVVGGYLTVG